VCVIEQRNIPEPSSIHILDGESENICRQQSTPLHSSRLREVRIEPRDNAIPPIE
jgi:hypothetical protein